MFEKASKMKLRFETTKGSVSTEDLWDFNLTQLNLIAKSLNRKLKESDEEDFLDEKSDEDKIIKLQFDIVLHILEAKKSEKKDKELAIEKKALKEKILEIKARKQENALENLSDEELDKKLAELG